MYPTHLMARGYARVEAHGARVIFHGIQMKTRELVYLHAKKLVREKTRFCRLLCQDFLSFVHCRNRKDFIT